MLLMLNLDKESIGMTAANPRSDLDSRPGLR
jgi:hypothetical protein